MDPLSVCDVNLICRICLQGKENLEFIFSSLSCDIMKKIIKCADVEIYENDGLPSNICNPCLNNLAISYDFRTLCESSDRALRDAIVDNTKKEDDDEVPVMPLVDVIIKVEPKDESDGGEYNEENSAIESSPKEDISTNRDRILRKTRMQCRSCSFQFRTFSELESHSKTCEKKKKKLSTTTKRTYTRRKPLRVHRCDTCNKVFTSRKCWAKHMALKHHMDVPLRPQNECKICNGKFNCWSELVDHEKRFGHYAKEQCPYCNKSFCRSYISLHLREHSSEDPLLCNTCGRTYTNLASFKNHVKCCTNAEKKLQCSYCEKRFHTQNRLTQHARMHSKEKPYVCETCGAGFRRRNHLKNHVMVHEDARPYSCSVCQKRFRTSTVLNEHMRVHTGIRPYVCDICSAAFTQKHCLKTHNKIKHDRNCNGDSLSS